MDGSTAADSHPEPTMGNLEWLESENDAPMLVQRIHKNRIIGKFFNAANIENMYKVPLRPDDILLCSYPKSGTHWVWDNVRMLIAGQVLPDTVEKEQQMMELFDDREAFEKFPSPRILNNHVYFDDQPTDLRKGQAKLILVYRNPKDICVSFYNHHSKIQSYKYDGKFCNYITRFLHGKVSSSCCFDYWNMWEQGLKDNPNIPHLLVRYEDLHQNPISERRRIAKFLGHDYEDAFLQKVADATSIDAMRKNKDQVSLKDGEGQAVMYRKGKAGDWKDHFTVSQSEMFDKVVEEHMGKSEMFKFVYSLDEKK